MPFYRVSGESENRKKQSVVIEARSLDDALSIGHNRGLFKIEGELITDDELPVNQKSVGVKQPAGTLSDRLLIESELFISPVWTIAKGVALGLFLHSVVVIAIYFVIHLVGDSA